MLDQIADSVCKNGAGVLDALSLEVLEVIAEHKRWIMSRPK